MAFRRRRLRGVKADAKVDMTSLIDLTFLLLVTFIVTLPALEQGVQIMLPQAEKLPPPPMKDRKANTISIDAANQVFLNDKPLTLDELEKELRRLVAEDADVPVLVRGDERLNYGAVMDVVKIIYKCKVTKMALITVEK